MQLCGRLQDGPKNGPDPLTCVWPQSPAGVTLPYGKPRRETALRWLGRSLFHTAGRSGFLSRSPRPAFPSRHNPRALNSAVECHLHTVEVAGSNPAAPTIESTTYGLLFGRFSSICSKLTIPFLESPPFLIFSNIDPTISWTLSGSSCMYS